MRPETNKEIDLLLRGMAQANGAARDGVQSDDRHLDADELSSYAQNALPAAARARYTEHLAECETCRRLITELSLTLGSAVVAEPVQAVANVGGWKKFLASLLSPMVLRYAVPALGVIVVMVLGFVVLRRQQRSEFTAQLEPRAATAPSVTPEVPDTKGFVANGQSKLVDKIESQNSKTDTKVKTEPGRTEDSVARAPAAPPVREEKLIAESRQPAAPEPTPAATTGAAERDRQRETTSAARKEPETAKEKVEAASEANEAPRDQAAAKPTSAAQSQPAAAPSSNSGFAGLRGLSARRAETAKPATAAKTGAADKDAGNSTADDETRTVAGRRFRKQGNAWIDTAYQSSTATVNMARDSEQFRALVADEPAIGTIAKQLDGEVIVVWKGHAYRIR